MRIKERRKACGITQVQLAELLGVGQSTVCGWETGAIKVPSDTIVSDNPMFRRMLNQLKLTEPVVSDSDT